MGRKRYWLSCGAADERDAAELLGIPYDDVMQVALLPVAYTKGIVVPEPR